MPGQRNRPTMQKPKKGLSKSFSRKLSGGMLGRFIHAANYKGAKDVGRNSPCPCGSGKKFKKCCGKSN